MNELAVLLCDHQISFRRREQWSSGQRAEASTQQILMHSSATNRCSGGNIIHLWHGLDFSNSCFLYKDSYVLCLKLLAGIVGHNYYYVQIL